ncbi:MAG: methylmalonyl Co-A mutase-associated GTPase MeaB, partial [Deltaproteobacteria bacterium]|nr:methylmalonyl Co-A mutase-associated GTPase MeaB [Deltaproteobacteria bacterium]
VVLVETVGVGQDEVDIIRTAHTALVVLVPGLGDEVQALKAGILEIADLFAVNKADREGADRTVGEIETMLALRDSGVALRDASPTAGQRGRPEAAADSTRSGWRPPVLKVIATSGQGVAEVVEQIAAHRAALSGTAELGVRLAYRAREVFVRLLHDELWRRGVVASGLEAAVDAAVARIVARTGDPYREAARLCQQVLGSTATG